MRREASAAARNRRPILDVLHPHLPTEGLVLEIASGTGEHIVHFARALPGLVFQPSDPDEAARASIDDWTRTCGLGNVRPALAIDVAQPDWPCLPDEVRANAVVCINMIHIAPWEATTGLLEGAARRLATDGLLFLYGPFHREGRPTSPGNALFDADLRRRDPAWGVRHLEDVVAAARTHGFAAPLIVDMPANNLSLVFRRSDRAT